MGMVIIVPTGDRLLPPGMTPALTWDGVPNGTAGLVLLVDDPDAPVEGSFVHWVLFNLDPARQGIAEGEVPAEATAGANGLGRPGHPGPAPPPDDRPHRHAFRLPAAGQPVPAARPAQLPGRRIGRDRSHTRRSAAHPNLPAVAPTPRASADPARVSASAPRRRPQTSAPAGQGNSPARPSRRMPSSQGDNRPHGAQTTPAAARTGHPGTRTPRHARP